MELLPVRCYTCGKVLANRQEEYDRLIASGVRADEAMDRLGFKRVCCRQRVMSPEIYVGGVDVLNPGPSTIVRRMNQVPSATPARPLATGDLPNIERLSISSGKEEIPTEQPRLGRLYLAR